MEGNRFLIFTGGGKISLGNLQSAKTLLRISFWKGWVDPCFAQLSLIHTPIPISIPISVHPMKFLRFLSAFLLTISPLAAAQQVVMDFNSIPRVGTVTPVPTPYLEKGMQITSVAGWSMLGPGGNGYTGGNALINASNVAYTTSVLSLQGGGPFTLVSVRIAPIAGNFDVFVSFVGTKANGTTVERHTSTGGSLSGVVLPMGSTFQNVVSVSWTTEATGRHQFDDITAIIPTQIIPSSNVTLTEGYGAANVGVSLSNPLATDTSVSYTIADGTATQPADYTRPGGLASGTLTIPAGETAATLAIPIVDDALAEARETFTVNFGTAPAGTSYLGVATSTVVGIGNNDNVTDFAGWMTGHGLTSTAALPTADPNGDGISNVEAWLFRINPAGPSSRPWLQRRAAPLVGAGTQGSLRFTVPSPAPADVSITFEESVNLVSWIQQASRGGFGPASSWAGTGASRVTDVLSAGSHTVTCAASQPLFSRPKTYTRLKYGLISAGTGGN